MNELTNVVMQRTGLSQEDAEKAVHAVLDVLKQKLPGPIASHLDSFLSGGLSGEVSKLSEQAGDLIKGKLGGLFGGS